MENDITAEQLKIKNRAAEKLKTGAELPQQTITDADLRVETSQSVIPDRSGATGLSDQSNSEAFNLAAKALQVERPRPAPETDLPIVAAHPDLAAHPEPAERMADRGGLPQFRVADPDARLPSIAELIADLPETSPLLNAKPFPTRGEAKAIAEAMVKASAPDDPREFILAFIERLYGKRE